VLPSAGAKAPAALVGLTSPTCGAGPCHCAGCSHLQCCYRREQKCQQHKQALPLLLVGPCHAIVPDVVSYSAAMRPAAPAGDTSRTRDASPCHCAGGSHLQGCHQLGQKCPQHLQALHLLLAGQCHALTADFVSRRAATRVWKSASSTSRLYISYLRGSAMPLCRVRSPTVLAPGPAAPAGGYVSYAQCDVMPLRRM